MRFSAELLLAGLLAYAAYLFWKLHQRDGGAGAKPPFPAQGLPPYGAAVIPLGQYAVPPDRRWLLVKPGQ